MAEEKSDALAPCGQAYPHIHSLFILPLDSVLHYFETLGRELPLGEKFSHPLFWAYLVGHLLVGEHEGRSIVDVDIIKGGILLHGAILRISSFHESATAMKFRIELVYNSSEKVH